MSHTPPQLGTLEYVVEVAKDWTLARLVEAQTADYRLPPQRFELFGAVIRRRPLAPASPEAQSPFDAVRRARQPTAWTHSTVVTMLTDSARGTVEYEQEAVEILAMAGSDILVECAFVVRSIGLPPCLGPFWLAR